MLSHFLGHFGDDVNSFGDCGCVVKEVTSEGSDCYGSFLLICLLYMLFLFLATLCPPLPTIRAKNVATTILYYHFCCDVSSYSTFAKMLWTPYIKLCEGANASSRRLFAEARLAKIPARQGNFRLEEHGDQTFTSLALSELLMLSDVLPSSTTSLYTQPNLKCGSQLASLRTKPEPTGFII